MGARDRHLERIYIDATNIPISVMKMLDLKTDDKIFEVLTDP